MNKVEGCTFCGGEPVYQFQCREIGEGDWEPCDHSRYMYCQKSPEHDTRVVQVGISAGVVDDRAAFETWYLGHFYMGDKQCGLEWLSTEPCGGYRHQHPAEQWIVWQARATLKAQPSGVVQWPDADEIMQMAFEEGQHGEDASGYYFELEEFDLFIQRLMEEVARLNSSPVSAGDDRETIRAVFLRNGFTIKEGQADLKPYVYAAADELMSIARAALSAPSHGGGVAHTDCRSEDGITVGLIDSIITSCRVLSSRDLTCEAAVEALRDLRSDSDVSLIKPSHGEQVRDVLPGGWTAKPTDDREGFIISSPRINGVASHFAVFPDSNGFASRALWRMLSTSPSAGDHKEKSHD